MYHETCGSQLWDSYGSWVSFVITESQLLIHHLCGHILSLVSLRPFSDTLLNASPSRVTDAAHSSQGSRFRKEGLSINMYLWSVPHFPTSQAPVLHYWFRFLDKRIVGNRGIQPLKKVLVDQSMMPTFINATIIVWLELMQRQKWPAIKNKIQNNLPSILWNQYKIWPAVQLVNFYVVPIQYRVIVVAVVAFFWNIYLANALQSSKSGETLSS